MVRPETFLQFVGRVTTFATAAAPIDPPAPGRSRSQTTVTASRLPFHRLCAPRCPQPIRHQTAPRAESAGSESPRLVLSGRVEHRRKIAERLALDSREYASDGPSRTAESAGIVRRARRSGLRSIVGSRARTARNLDNRENTVCFEFLPTNR